METLKPLVDQLTEIIKSGTNLAKEQLPDVAQQIIRYKIAESITMMALCVFVFIVSEILRRKFISKHNKDEYIDGGWMVGAVVLVTFGHILPFICFICSAFDLVKLTLAPKVFLLQYLSEMLKK